MTSNCWNTQNVPNVARYVPDTNSGASRQQQQSYGQQHSYAQQHHGYGQASTGYGSSSNSYTSSSAAHTPASNSYTTSSTSYAPAPASGSYTPASTSYAPSATASASAQPNYASSSTGYYDQPRNGYSTGQDASTSWNNSRSYSSIRETSSRAVESPPMQHNSLYEAPYMQNNIARDASSASASAPHIYRTSYTHNNTPTVIEPSLTVKNALPPSSYTFRTAQPSPQEPPPNPAPVPAPAPEPQASTQEKEAAPSEPPDAPAGPEQGLEAEIRAMMAKMREYNSKDPALLARIWEEERRSKTPKSTNAQNRPSLHVPAAEPVQQKASPSLAAAPAPKKTDPKKGSTGAKTAQSIASVQADTLKSEPTMATETTESGKKAAPKVPGSANSKSTKTTAVMGSTAKVTSGKATPLNPRPEDAPQAQPTPAAAAAVLNKAPSRGGTIWPSEKKTHLSKVAAKYLNNLNKTQTMEPPEILKILDGNPSYIELCEQLEQFGLEFDRGAFAKTLLAAVPDTGGSSRRAGSGPSSAAAKKTKEAPIAKPTEPGTPVYSSLPAAYVPKAVEQAHYPSDVPVSPPPEPVAQMVSAKTDPAAETMPELMPEPMRALTKEEAARKRNLSDLIDLTALSDDDGFGPPRKKANMNRTPFGAPPHPSSFAVPLQPSSFITPPQPLGEHAVDSEPAIANLLQSSLAPTANNDVASRPENASIRHPSLVSELDKKKALRRNTYNPSTIARDVLLACGRHPSLRQLNQHLEILRSNLPLVGYDSDLSSIRWDWIDPGQPPPGYFKNRAMPIIEDIGKGSSGDGDEDIALAQATSDVIGGSQKAQALPEPSNPFKPKKRGRPRLHPVPLSTPPTKPKSTPKPPSMSAVTPPSGSGAPGTGYSAFRQYGPDGLLLPKRKGRPVGWRKSIHGSPAAQARTTNNKPTVHKKPNQPSYSTNLRNVSTSGNQPILIDSRSPSVASNRAPQYQSYPCKWEGCKAELHNLETLGKHVFKVHRKMSPKNTLECLWDDCHKAQKLDPMTGLVIGYSNPYAFEEGRDWCYHIQSSHLEPVSWSLGDGPAGGIFDSRGSEAYLSDAEGRQITPRITIDFDRLQAGGPSLQGAPSVGRGRGRPPKSESEREVRDAHALLVSQKKRIGGPGMDRGGATLVNSKRRKGFRESSSGAEDSYVDAED